VTDTQAGGVGALGIISATDVDVPMRDGVVLRANVFRPDGEGAYPGLLLRTPYGKPAGGHDRYVRAGYAVVTQDSRGRYASDGEFVPFTEQHTGDAEDGYDSVEWLAAQPWCNGRVGTFGASYNAWMQWETARLRPPHLVAMCAYTIPLELTAVDWCGAFRAGRRIKWWLTTIAPDLRRRHGLPGPHTPAEARQLWDEVEQAHWVGYLPWKRFPDHLPPGLAEYAAEWLDEPHRRPWGFDRVHGEVEVPNLDFSGWYDHCNDTMHHLAGMQANGRTEAAREQTRLIIGPWNHPGLGKRQIGDIDFGPQAELDLPDLIVRWFDYWLKGQANGTDCEPAVRYFVMGANQWKATTTWPLPGTTPASYLLSGDSGAAGADGGGRLCAANGQAEAAASDAAAASSSYRYDPRDPVPTLWGKAWFTSPADRRQLEHRRDILRFRTEPLAEDVEVVGYPEVVLHVSSTAPDTDFFARLVDEHPGADPDGAGSGCSEADELAAAVESSGEPQPEVAGPALEVCYGMVRVRHRNTYEREELVEPGQVVELRIELGATACRFQAGHRIRLEITSSDFPNHDRNHNTGGDDLAETEMTPATQTVYHTEALPSRLILPVDASA